MTAPPMTATTVRNTPKAFTTSSHVNTGTVDADVDVAVDAFPCARVPTPPLAPLAPPPPSALALALASSPRSTPRSCAVVPRCRAMAPTVDLDALMVARARRRLARHAGTGGPTAREPQREVQSILQRSARCVFQMCMGKQYIEHASNTHRAHTTRLNVTVARTCRCR